MPQPQDRPPDVSGNHTGMENKRKKGTSENSGLQSGNNKEVLFDLQGKCVSLEGESVSLGRQSVSLGGKCISSSLQSGNDSMFKEVELEFGSNCISLDIHVLNR